MSRPFICWRCRSLQITRAWASRSNWARLSHTPDNVQRNGSRRSITSRQASTQVPRIPQGSKTWNDTFKGRGTSLIHSTTSQSRRYHSATSNRRSTSPASGLPELQRLANSPDPPAVLLQSLKSLDLFRQTSLPESLEIKLRKSPALRRLFHRLLRASLFDHDNNLPPFEEVIETFLDRGLFEYTLLHDVMRQAVKEILPATLRAEEGFAYNKILRRLMWTWNRIMSGHSSNLDLGETSRGGLDNLLVAMGVSNEGHGPKQAYLDQFGARVGGKVDQSLKDSLAADSALLFLCIETHRAQETAMLASEELDTWADFMSNTLRDSNGDLVDLSSILKHSPQLAKEFEADILAAWIPLQQRMSKETTADESGKVTPALSEPQANSTTMSLISHLRRISKHGHQRQALRMWLDFQERASEWNAVDRSAILAEFLWTFARTGLKTESQHIWQSMNDLGVIPGPSHWTAMIEAYKVSRDLDTLKKLWVALVQVQGIRPSNQLWTSYIDALVWLHDWQEAIRAVRIMGSQWKATVDSEPADYQPSMIPVNAAMSGMLKAGKMEYVEQLLTWAREQRLTMTIDTYNILIRSAIRQRDSERVRQLLGEMRKSGCEPDVITFTIFIDGLVRSSNSGKLEASAEAIHDAVLQVFADMDSINLKANTQTYTTLMHSFLDPRKLNLPAATATLERMSTEGLQPSPHVYRILAGHYFRAQPPNLEAVDALRQHVEANGLAMDRKFWDGLVEGYAAVGEIEKMLASLRKQAERPPSWKSLAIALRLLTASEEWALANELVRQVESERDHVSAFGQDRRELRDWHAALNEARGNGQLEKQAPGFVRRVHG